MMAELRREDLEIRRGSLPIVIYAPHGGRRNRPVRRSDGVNDLHTADIAIELAERLDAHALVNGGCDRNDVDLNRISDLEQRAPSVLAALRELVSAAAATGGAPLVVIVHGWNVSMCGVDVGVGIIERMGDLLGRYPTVSRATLDGVLARLRTRLAAEGIETSLGRRYPATARNNATQLFSGRHRDADSADVAALGAMAAAGAVDAVQLELAIPLRWPGHWRDAFVATAVELLAEEGRARVAAKRDDRALYRPRSEWRLPPIAKPDRKERLPKGHSLQAVLADGTGLLVGAEPTGADSMAARFCLVRPGGELLLFVGEGAWAGDARVFEVGGFQLAVEKPGDTEPSSRLVVHYGGPCVAYPTHDAFCDLEQGLAGSTLVPLEARLVHESDEEGFGRLHGYIRTPEETLDIDIGSFHERSSRRASFSGLRSRLHLTHGPRAPLSVIADDDGDAEGAILWRTGDDGLPTHAEVRLEEGEPVRAEVVSRVPVYRPIAGASAAVRVTFGVARMALGSGDALALFERIELVEASGVGDVGEA